LARIFRKPFNPRGRIAGGGHLEACKAIGNPRSSERPLATHGAGLHYASAQRAAWLQLVFFTLGLMPGAEFEFVVAGFGPPT
jgi:hypothetical protein